MSFQRFESVFNFRCPQCGHSDLLKLPVPQFNFNVERMSDLHSEDQIEFECPSCETEFAGDVTCTSASCEIAISEPSAFTMIGDPPMFSADPEEAYEPPTDPFSLFQETTQRCLIVADMEFDARNDPQFLKRMAFTTIVTALETYLSDSLLNEIKANNAALGSLIAKDRHFAAMKIPLADLVNSPDFASLHVRKSIQEIPFHNLPRADVIYKSALGISLRSDEDRWKRLNEDMRIRHDCVHRNGHNSDGERREDITSDFVMRAADDCRSLAQAVETQLRPTPF